MTQAWPVSDDLGPEPSDEGVYGQTAAFPSSISLSSSPSSSSSSSSPSERQQQHSAQPFGDIPTLSAAAPAPARLLSGGGEANPLPIQTVLACGGLFFMSGLYLLHLVALFYGRHRLHKTLSTSSVSNKIQEQQQKQLTSQSLDAKLPGVSILKPLLGTDENLEENLESFFRLDYPQFELLFCLHSRQDPAYEVAQRLCAKYPNVEARIFLGGQRVGLNPKINNMFPGYLASKFSRLLISDQGIFTRPQALTDMVLCMLERADIALVTQTPFCKDRPGIWAALEQVYFGGAHSRIYLASHAFRFVCSTGMSALMVKEVLEECGGFRQFGAFLAEDYFLGQAFANAGYRSVISHMPALQNSANTSLSTFRDRICRWIKLRIAMLPHTILLEPAQECVISSIVGALTVGYLFGGRENEHQQTAVVVFLAFHFLYWAICDFFLLRILQNGPLPFPLVHFLLCWLLRELLAFPIFVLAILNPHIGWRVGTYQLCWGGKIKPVKEN